MPDGCETSNFSAARALFLELLDLPVGERDSRLFAVSVNTPELAATVARMLRADTDASSVLDPTEHGSGLIEILAREGPAEPEPIPDRIAHFRIVGILGEGGMGLVYEAEQDRPQRRVALKTLHRRRTSDGTLEREAEALARLLHPNIPQVYEIGEREGRPWIAMELVDGERFPGRAASAPMRDRVRLLAELSETVQAAHDAGVLHRDLKASNLILTPDDRIKVLDFGLAAWDHEQAAGVAGTVDAMSPEAMRGDAVDARADVYSLGVLGWELLVGRPPFVGRDRSPPPTPEALPAELEACLRRAFATEADSRYATAQALSEDLRAWLAYRPVRARPPAAGRRLWLALRRNQDRLGIAALAVGTAGLLAVAAWGGARQIAQSLREAEADRRWSLVAPAVDRALAEGRLSDAQTLFAVHDSQLDTTDTAAAVRARLAFARSLDASGQDSVSEWALAWAEAVDEPTERAALTGLVASQTWGPAQREQLARAELRLGLIDRDQARQLSWPGAAWRGEVPEAAPEELLPVLRALSRAEPRDAATLPGDVPPAVVERDGRWCLQDGSCPWTSPFRPFRPRFWEADGERGVVASWLLNRWAVWASDASETPELLPGLERLDSTVTGVEIADFDLDGEDEVAVLLGEWRGYQALFYELTPDGPSLVDAVYVGPAAAGAAVVWQGRPHLGVMVSPRYEDPVLTEASDLSTNGLQLVRLRDGRAEIALDLPSPPGDGVLIDVYHGDLDGDGLEDLMARRGQPWHVEGLLVVRQLPDGSAARVELKLPHDLRTSDIDGDGDDELVVVVPDEPDQRLVIGTGAELRAPEPPPPEAPLRGEVAARARWLHELGLTEAALISLERGLGRADASELLAAISTLGGKRQDLGRARALMSDLGRDAPAALVEDTLDQMILHGEYAEAQELLYVHAGRIDGAQTREARIAELVEAEKQPLRAIPIEELRDRHPILTRAEPDGLVLHGVNRGPHELLRVPFDAATDHGVLSLDVELLHFENGGGLWMTAGPDEQLILHSRALGGRGVAELELVLCGTSLLATSQRFSLRLQWVGAEGILRCSLHEPDGTIFAAEALRLEGPFTASPLRIRTAGELHYGVLSEHRIKLRDIQVRGMDLTEETARPPDARWASAADAIRGSRSWKRVFTELVGADEDLATLLRVRELAVDNALRDHDADLYFRTHRRAFGPRSGDPVPSAALTTAWPGPLPHTEDAMFFGVERGQMLLRQGAIREGLRQLAVVQASTAEGRGARDLKARAHLLSWTHLRGSDPSVAAAHAEAYVRLAPTPENGRRRLRALTGRRPEDR